MWYPGDAKAVINGKLEKFVKKTLGDSQACANKSC